MWREKAEKHSLVKSCGPSLFDLFCDTKDTVQNDHEDHKKKDKDQFIERRIHQGNLLRHFSTHPKGSYYLPRVPLKIEGRNRKLASWASNARLFFKLLATVGIPQSN